MNCTTLFLNEKSQKTKSILTSKLKSLTVCLLTILTCSLITSGCLQEEAPKAPADSLAIKNLSLQLLNNSTFITGIAENVSNESVSNLFIEASGYNENNTLLKRGYADSTNGIKPIIAPGDKSPFMIRLYDIVHKNYSNTSEKLTITNLTTNATNNVKLDLLNQNDLNYIMQVNGRARSSILSFYYNKSIASYKVKPFYNTSPDTPYSLIVINNKTIDGNQKILVTGEIYNNGTKVLNSSIVAAAFYGRNSTVLGLFLNHVIVQIPPAKTSAFQIEIPKKDFSINIREIALIEIYAYMVK